MPLAFTAMSDAELRNQYFDRLFGTPGLRWMGQNTNHVPLPEAVLQAMADSIAHDEFRAYAPPLGFEALRDGIARDLGLPGARAMVTDGGVAALYHLCHALLAPGDRFVTTDPGWKWPPVFARAIGAEVIEVPVYDPACGYHLTAERLAGAVDGRTRAIYLVDPNNPLGTCVPADEMERILGVARRAGAVLIHDCTYRHFATAHTLAASLDPAPVVTIYSFSKWLGLAGLRVGALVAAPALFERLAGAPPNNLGSNVTSQRAAMAGLAAQAEWFPGVQALQRRNQAAIKAAADGVPGLRLPVYPSHGNFLVVECEDAGVRPEALAGAMARRGILIRQGSYHTPRFGDRFVKVSTTVPGAWADEFCAALPEAVAEARETTTVAALY
jgi:histidinol-phosphate/aromatic aminotransferase/cobyric acid decarboxylase-like protein